MNDIPCNNFVREGTPGSEARLVGSFHTRLVVGAEPFLRDPKPRGAHGAEGEGEGEGDPEEGMEGARELDILSRKSETFEMHFPGGPLTP